MKVTQHLDTFEKTRHLDTFEKTGHLDTFEKTRHLDTFQKTQHLDTFESDTTSNQLNHTVWPIRTCFIFFSNLLQNLG